MRWAARRLGVIDPRPSLRVADLDSATLESLGADVLELRPADLGIDDGEVLSRVAFPGRGLVVAIERGDELVLPRGSTTIERSDRLYLLVERDLVGDVRRQIQRVAAAEPG